MTFSSHIFLPSSFQQEREKEKKKRKTKHTRNKQKTPPKPRLSHGITTANSKESAVIASMGLFPYLVSPTCSKPYHRIIAKLRVEKTSVFISTINLALSTPPLKHIPMYYIYTCFKYLEGCRCN